MSRLYLFNKNQYFNQPILLLEFADSMLKSVDSIPKSLY